MFNLTAKPDDNPQGLIQTIEFRQHAGTLEPISVLSWIDLVMRLVTCCHWTYSDQFDSLFRPDGRYRDASLNAIDILRELGCQDRTVEHYEASLTGESERLLQLNSIKQQAEKLDDQDYTLAVLARLAVRNVDDENAYNDPGNIRGRIVNKLLYGGYGQSNDKDLDLLLPNDTHQQVRSKLRLGYMPSP